VPELFPAGTVPGHEFSGRIVSVGDGGTDKVKILLAP
jgi:threonine dehydrogenase-like Zn-dependent dehydrogenase